jgi:hypothetical protein
MNDTDREITDRRKNIHLDGQKHEANVLFQDPVSLTRIPIKQAVLRPTRGYK